MTAPKLPKVRLQHILESIDGILDATSGRSEEEMVGDYLTQRALERAVEIISEAAKALPVELCAQEPDVSWADIIGIGNYLRHEYFRIRRDVMMDILRHQLPELRPAIVRLLASIEASNPSK